MVFSRDARTSQQPSLDLHVGRRVEVGVNMSGEFRWLRSQVAEQVRADGRLVVAWPTKDHGQSVSARLGQSVVVVASSEGALFSAEMVVEGGANGHDAFLLLRPERPWQRAQRRQDVRLPFIVQPTVAKVVAANGSRPIQATITNVSAGGLHLRSEQQVDVGDQVYVAFVLPGSGKEMHAHLDVRHVERSARSEKEIWNAGCQFKDLQSAQRESIVKFIFAQQRSIARRQNGLE
jgi:c-di-GMP-binding flagellar brake protein YcgR